MHWGHLQSHMYEWVGPPWLKLSSMCSLPLLAATGAGLLSLSLSLSVSLLSHRSSV